VANSKNVIRHPLAPRPRAPKKLAVSDVTVARSRQKRRQATTTFNPFVAPQHPPGVIPSGVLNIAQDEDVSSAFGWAQSALFSAFAEGMVFPGYAELSL